MIEVQQTGAADDDRRDVTLVASSEAPIGIELVSQDNRSSNQERVTMAEETGVVGDSILLDASLEDGDQLEPPNMRSGYRGSLAEATLVERQLNPAVIDDLVSRLDRIDKKRRQLVEFSVAQGLSPQERAQALTAIDDQVRAIRQELGDDNYDRYLGGADLPNRLVIGSTVVGEALETAGIMPGDVFVSYDGAKVFSMTDLRTKPATKEWVPVVMSRAGKTFESLVQAGPLGVEFSTASANPDADLGR
ncbi:MAG: hypothetical protein U1B30_11490 [Pseudomonadota bacterium]|nr:hypothetical protein [Pseudomonadota bacterium]